MVDEKWLTKRISELVAQHTTYREEMETIAREAWEQGWKEANQTARVEYEKAHADGYATAEREIQRRLDKALLSAAEEKTDD